MLDKSKECVYLTIFAKQYNFGESTIFNVLSKEEKYGHL